MRSLKKFVQQAKRKKQSTCMSVILFSMFLGSRQDFGLASANDRQSSEHPVIQQSFSEKMDAVVWPFYRENGQESVIKTQDNVDIQVVHFENPNARGHVYFLTGVNDTYLRNMETLYDLFQSGYSPYQ